MARPRDPRRDEAILQAARHVLAEVGFAGLTIEAVAERAGVGRPTVYRRWPTKAELVLATFQDDPASPRGSPADQPAAAPDTGTLRGDLQVLVARLVDGFSHMDRSGAIGGIAAEMATNVDFALEVRQRWLDPDERELAVVFDRAARRGEVPEGVDGPAVLGVLAGAVFYRLVVLHQPCTPEWQGLLVDLARRGVEP